MNVDIPTTKTVKAGYDSKSRVLTLAPQCDLKSTTIAELHRDVFEIISHESVRALVIDEIRLDLSAASLVDSLGLNLIIAVCKWTKKREAKISIVVAKLGVHSTMLAVGLERQANLIFAEKKPQPEKSD